MYFVKNNMLYKLIYRGSCKIKAVRVALNISNHVCVSKKIVEFKDTHELGKSIHKMSTYYIQGVLTVFPKIISTIGWDCFDVENGSVNIVQYRRHIHLLINKQYNNGC